jgi:tetratricopeptide (TPR) repeat protein
LPGRQVRWPVRSGSVPPQAEGFSTRLESAPGLGATLVAGTAAVLGPGRKDMGRAGPWLRACGKTQLAVSFAESLWHSREVDLLVWVVATSRASVLTGYLEAAVTATGIDPADDAESVASRFASWLGETRRPWLVVLDGLSDEADVEGLWPDGPAGRVLITTDSPAVAGPPRAPVHPVGLFTAREALSYLMGRLTADPDQRIGAIDLARELGGEPLALVQASAVIASGALSCRDYQAYFGRRRAELAAAGGEPAAAEVTWTFSVEQAERLWPGGTATPLLTLAALLDGHGIPGEVFTSAAACAYLAGEGAQGPAGPEQARGALLTLERTGLLDIDRTGTPPTVRLCPVIQAAVRKAMPEGMLDRTVKAAADALLEVWPGDEPQPWLTGDLRSSAACLQQVAGDLLWADGCHPLLMRAGRSLVTGRLTGPAVGYWSTMAAVSDRVLGRGHPDTLVTIQQLADAYLAAGRPAEAVSRFQWVLADRTRALGPDHPGTITARRNLGRAAAAADHSGDAVTILEGAVADYERVCGASHPDTLGARDELAAAYRAAGQFAAAIRSGRSTLASRERLQGPQHPDTMTTRQQLADAYLADDRLKDALSQYKRTLADRERILGPGHPDTLATVGTLAAAYHLARRLRDAIPLYERVLRDREHALGPDHPDTLGARGNLASAYHSAGRLASALELYERSRADCQHVLGANHPDTLAARANLAHAYYDLGRLTEAVTLLQQTLADCEQFLAPADPLTQAVRESLDAVTRG